MPSHTELSASVDVTVVLPCHNEEQHVAAEVTRICRGLESSGYSYELIAIDDGSTDQTWARLQEAARGRPTVQLLQLGVKRGTGNARRLGTQLARGAVVVWTDADMTYPNESIHDLVRMLAEDPLCAQVVGARHTEGGPHILLRTGAKWAIRKLAERLAGVAIPDLNSGLRAFRRCIAMPYLPLLPSGFSCVTTLTLAFLADQHQIQYAPVPYAQRSGRSKFRPVRDTYRYLLQVLRISTYFNPLRVFTPFLGIVLLLGALSEALQFYFDLEWVSKVVLVLMIALVASALALLCDAFAMSRTVSRGAQPSPCDASQW
jgi:glycosyltransferase involved in cell wall biosynthesis